MVVLDRNINRILLYALYVCLVGSSNAEEEIVNPYSVIFAQTDPPVLFDKSQCSYIVDGLLGTQSAEASFSHIVKLDATTTLPGSQNRPDCVVNSVYLDAGPAWTVTTEYDRFTTSTDTRYESEIIWDSRFNSVSQTQLLAIVSCDEGAWAEPIPEMRNDTDFGFILDPGKGLSLSLLKCYVGFCLIRITSETCVHPIISKQLGVLPATYSNRLKHMQKKTSMEAISMDSIIMRIQENRFNATILQTQVKMGLDTIKGSGSFETICINTKNLACTQEEAYYYGMQLMRILKIITKVADSFVEFVGVTKLATADDVFAVQYYSYDYQHMKDDTLESYMREFRECPRLTMSTGADRFFYEDNVVYEIGCISCPINTYYDESIIPPTETNGSQHMYVHGISDGGARDGTTTTAYTISSDQDVNDKRERLYSEIIIEIGKTLVLQFAGTTSMSFGKVECDGSPLQIISNTSTMISIEMKMELSGKLIMVHIHDPNLRDGNNGDFEWKTTPVYILPRHSEITGMCKPCPPGTFSGSYAASNISACRPTKKSTSATRRLLSTVPVESKNTSAVIYIQIKNQIIVILGIADDTVHPESDFCIEIYLRYDNLTFVQENIQLVTQKVLQTYNVDNSDMKYITSNLRLHASNVSVIFGIHGNYTNSIIPDQNNAVTDLDIDIFQWIFFAITLTIVIVIPISVLLIHRHKTDWQTNDNPVHLHTTQSEYFILCQNAVPV